MRFCAVRVDLRIPALPSQIWSADCEPIGQCDQMTCCPIFASSTLTQQGTSPCITDPLDMPFLFELSTMGDTAGPCFMVDMVLAKAVCWRPFDYHTL